MEKEFFSNAATQAPPGWSSINQHHELNCSSEQLTSYFFNPNWDGSMDQGNDPFESALSSMVSSPSAAASALNASNESVVLRELIGRLGSICNSTDISPHHSYNNINNNNTNNNNNNCNSTNTSCYSTPLNSPPKLNLSMMDQQMRGNLPIPGSHPTLAPFSADPGFAERAARLSCFGSRSFNSRTNNGQYGLNNESEKQIPRVSSCHSLKVPGPQMVVVQDGIQLPDKKYNGYSRSNTPENADSREESSVSEQIPAGDTGLKGQNDSSSKKRKSIPRGKAKEIQSANHAKDLKDEDSNKKRSKSEEANGNDKSEEKNAGEGNQKQSKDNSKPPEPPKDYIHVRARRGQATDSHSLAERVRREKISERMKFLQDLVPGCNKVTGKAVMLDEIINYVQSLQRQVEFLSMKLATVNPRMDVNMDALLPKDILQSRGTLTQNMYPLESSAAFPYAYQSQGAPLQNVLANGSEAPYSMSPLSSALRRSQGMQMASIDGFVEASSQMSMWDDELNSMVQMGFPQSQPQNFQGSMAASQMKLEL